MAKVKSESLDLSPTRFNLTFAIEIIGLDVWHDCNEGQVELGPCSQGMKVNYQLYPGRNFELNIFIWPHAVKIWCGMQSGWVRTWQFLDRRWLTFDISHIFPVRVAELQAFVATVTPTVGLGGLSHNAKYDSELEIYIPRLEFGQKRYFAPVISEEISLVTFIHDLIWKTIENYIPVSYLDGLFDVPHLVTDVRHQDAVIYHVTERALSRNLSVESDEESHTKELFSSKQSSINQKKKVDVPVKPKFEIFLPGDTILAGVGRQVLFKTFATHSRPAELGEFLVFISSQNLPAIDDHPIFFINIDSLFDVPSSSLEKYNITHIYTRWSIGDEVHDSEHRPISSQSTYEIDDQHAVLLPCNGAFKIISCLLDDFFRIELRGIRKPPITDSEPEFFGYGKKDRFFGTNFPPKVKEFKTDIIIANTKICARQNIVEGVNGVVAGEYPLYPPTLSVRSLGRQGLCTNDQNGIKLPVIPEQIVPSYVILDAQMSLQVRLGYAGCRQPCLKMCFSRIIVVIRESRLILEILKEIDDINSEQELIGQHDNHLTGFAVDIGDVVICFVEGPSVGSILYLWEKTGGFFPYTSPVYSSSARYSNRVYPSTSFATTLMPFMVMKMYIPLTAVLACPPVYAKPVLPILARNAAVKLGRFLGKKMRWRLGPATSELPTAAELVSFRQELCVPPKTPNIFKSAQLLKTLQSSADFT